MHGRNSVAFSSKDGPLSKISLPQDFASRLLGKELELDSHPSMAVVHELVDLYQQAIEYYENLHDARYIDFQDRLHRTLLRPEVLKVMAADSSSPTPISSSSSPACTPVETFSAYGEDSLINRKLDSERKKSVFVAEFQKTVDTKSHKTTRTMLRIIDSHSDRTKNSTSRARKDFNDMENKLKQRLAARMRRSSANCHKIIREESSDEEPRVNSGHSSRRNSLVSKRIVLKESDVSGGSARKPHRPLEDLEKKLEELMERCFAEKAAKVAEVKVKYETQIRELEKERAEGGGDVIKTVIEQMKRSREEEIARIADEMDSRRKDEIKDLKSEYRLS
jgi:hypothetical protein